MLCRSIQLMQLLLQNNNKVILIQKYSHNNNNTDPPPFINIFEIMLSSHITCDAGRKRRWKLTKFSQLQFSCTDVNPGVKITSIKLQETCEVKAIKKKVLRGTVGKKCRCPNSVQPDKNSILFIESYSLFTVYIYIVQDKNN